MYDRDDPQWVSEKQFRSALERLARDRSARAVVIRAGASSSARRKAAALIGATHVYLLMPDARECAHRVARRARADVRHGLASVPKWFAAFDRQDGVEDFPGWDEVAASGGLGIGATSQGW